MKAAAIVFLCLILWGCAPPPLRRDIAACRTEAFRSLPNEAAKPKSEAITAYIQNCMEAKGYVFNISHKDCPTGEGLGDAAYFEQCYDSPRALRFSN
jgi:hypothetical protein